MKQFRYTFNKKILLLVLTGAIMVCSSCLMYVYSPFNLLVNKLLTLEPGTFMFKLWERPPVVPTLKLYIFNFTNPEEFLRGEEKLKVTEIGPYCYKEYLSHTNVSYNSEDGTLTFSPKRELVMADECSVGDPYVDRILAPNIPLLGIQSFLISSSFLTNIGFSTLSASVRAQSFVNVTVQEYLWGYADKLVTMANKYIPSWIDFEQFGIFERLLLRDNTNKVTIAVHPEKWKSRYASLLTEEERALAYHIVKWNGQEGLSEWGYDSSDEAIGTTKRCHLVEGAFDGTFYSRPMKKRNITMFRNAFCRPVTLQYIEEGHTAQGFKSYNYKIPDDLFASPEENPANECYCYNGECPGKGVQNIAPCYYGIPIVLSQPHFLNSPPEIVNSVHGMEPVEEKHGSIAKMQPDIGSPLDESALRIQINLGVGQTRYNTRTKPFNGLVLPILWIELGCESLSDYVSFLMTLVLDVVPVVQKILIYILGVVGLGLISGAALLTLFFTKTTVSRSLSISSEYVPVPLITIPSHYFKEKELRLCK